MDSLVKLFYMEEIQLLVLLSFTLQLFLFFTGNLRRCSTNIFLRVSIWIAYLGADLVAVYAIGFLSRGGDDVHIARHTLTRGTQPLAFFWAFFLLIHLGGQDTITAFSMEDNNLWLRHLLNFLVQVALAMQVFWKSVGRHGVELLLSAVFLFVAGVIKYGERTWSLKCGRIKSFASSTGHQYKQRSPEENDWDSSNYYSKIVLEALRSMPNVHSVFAARSPFSNNSSAGVSSLSAGLGAGAVQDTQRMLKVVDLELGMMYDDLYTKALVLRTRVGIMLRCLSHISLLVAFGLFFASDKRRYGRVDIAITYSLFIGALFLDLSAVSIFMMSPWTWVWLKARKWERLASLSWFLFSSDIIGVPDRKPWWSNSMGQYSLLGCWVSGGREQPRSCNQQVMNLVERLVKNLVGAGKESVLWMSKLLDTQYAEADEKTVGFVVSGIRHLRDEFFQGAREWPNLGPLLEKIRIYYVADFGTAIVVMHMFTEVYLNAGAAAADADADAIDMVEVCRKLSNYMMYLFVTQPSMLPLNASSEATLVEFARSIRKLLSPAAVQQPSKLKLQELYNLLRQDQDVQPRRGGGGTVEELYKIILDADIQPNKTTLDEMTHMWMRLLLYTAGRSRGQGHAALLARGGEFITFLWLLMAKEGLGDSEPNRVRMTSTISFTDSAGGGTHLKEVYAFYFPC